ncbi:MAG: winged helix-turn-helix transcriptional regulator [Oscillospiraceae bacterium]|nr:winged helix-turn-helix transcriptional regulator [Oscillospiraceae bacterium]
MKQRFETFTVLINRISRNIRKIKNQEMSNHHLRSPHISCLYYLYTQAGLTATDLCDRCEEDKATISRSLEYLETNGYLVCEDTGPKRYKSHFLLTEKGLAAGKEIFDKINMVLDNISDGLTEEERIAFYRSLTIIGNSLDAIADKYE